MRFYRIFILCRFIYETEHFNGVGELLEILGRLVKREKNEINKKKTF